MDYKDAISIFESNIKRSVVQIERCSVGIANYVFIVSTVTEKFILRCSKDEDAYKDTVYWLNKLSVCKIPIPIVLSEGKYQDYSYLILSYIPGDDIGNVYCRLSDSEKKQARTASWSPSAPSIKKNSLCPMGIRKYGTLWTSAQRWTRESQTGSTYTRASSCTVLEFST